MPRKVLVGKVIGDQNDKTVTVLVERRFKHAVMKKIVKRSKKFTAHDPSNQSSLGDMIRIRECLPKSKSKCWEVVE